MTIELTVLISVVVGGCGIIFGLLAYNKGRNDQASKDKDRAKNIGVEQGHIITDLDYIKKGIDELKCNQTRFDERHYKLDTRVTISERSIAEVKEDIKSILDKLDEIKFIKGDTGARGAKGMRGQQGDDA